VSKHFAVVSIGTNSTRVLLADMAPAVPRVDFTRSIGTRVGQGLQQTGHLDETAMARTLDAVRSHVRAVRGHYLRIFCIATSAVRRADNREAFAERVRALVGAPLRVLDGDEEADASYRGALTVLDPHRAAARVGVIDTGGGSTEYAIGDGAHPERTISCEIGAVRLTEAAPALAGLEGAVDLATIDQARGLAREALTGIADFAAVDQIVLVGGTATSAASVLRGSRTKIDRHDVTRADLQRILVRLCGMPLEERKAIPGIKAQRADILPAGLIVLDTALDILGHDRALVTSADLLIGFLMSQRDAAGTPPQAPGGRSSVPQPASR
jgi:exopolyphosphatase/guanosine-5'-triphosphate,3'-diphosphate pyrophosphatase